MADPIPGLGGIKKELENTLPDKLYRQVLKMKKEVQYDDPAVRQQKFQEYVASEKGLTDNKELMKLRLEATGKEIGDTKLSAVEKKMVGDGIDKEEKAILSALEKQKDAFKEKPGKFEELKKGYTELYQEARKELGIDKTPAQKAPAKLNAAETKSVNGAINMLKGPNNNPGGQKSDVEQHHDGLMQTLLTLLANMLGLDINQERGELQTPQGQGVNGIPDVNMPQMAPRPAPPVVAQVIVGANGLQSSLTPANNINSAAPNFSVVAPGMKITNRADYEEALGKVFAYSKGSFTEQESDKTRVEFAKIQGFLERELKGEDPKDDTAQMKAERELLGKVKEANAQFKAIDAIKNDKDLDIAEKLEKLKEPTKKLKDQCKEIGGLSEKRLNAVDTQPQKEVPKPVQNEDKGNAKTEEPKQGKWGMLATALMAAIGININGVSASAVEQAKKPDDKAVAKQSAAKVEKAAEKSDVLIMLEEAAQKKARAQLGYAEKDDLQGDEKAGVDKKAKELVKEVTQDKSLLGPKEQEGIKQRQAMMTAANAMNAEIGSIRAEREAAVEALVVAETKLQDVRNEKNTMNPEAQRVVSAEAIRDEAKGKPVGAIKAETAMVNAKATVESPEVQQTAIAALSATVQTVKVASAAVGTLATGGNVVGDLINFAATVGNSMTKADEGTSKNAMAMGSKPQTPGQGQAV